MHDVDRNLEPPEASDRADGGEDGGRQRRERQAEAAIAHEEQAEDEHHPETEEARHAPAHVAVGLFEQRALVEDRRVRNGRAQLGDRLHAAERNHECLLAANLGRERAEDVAERRREERGQGERLARRVEQRLVGREELGPEARVREGLFQPGERRLRDGQALRLPARRTQDRPERNELLDEPGLFGSRQLGVHPIERLRGRRLVVSHDEREASRLGARHPVAHASVLLRNRRIGRDERRDVVGDLRARDAEAERERHEDRKDGPAPPDAEEADHGGGAALELRGERGPRVARRHPRRDEQARGRERRGDGEAGEDGHLERARKIGPRETHRGPRPS